MATFLQYLQEQNYLTADQIKLVKKEQATIRNSTFYGIVKRNKLIPDDQLLDIACKFFNFSRIEDAFEIEVDLTATCKITRDIFRAMDLRVFVCKPKSGGELICVLNDPENEPIKAKAISTMGNNARFALISEEDFAIIYQYQLVPNAISEQSGKVDVGESRANKRDSARLGSSNTQDLINLLINASLQHRASDLHLQPITDDKAQVILRIDGKLHPHSMIAADTLSNLRNVLRRLAKVGGESQDKPVEGQIQVDYRGQMIDVRINIVKSKLGYDFNLRFIDSNLKELSELGLTDKNYDSYHRLLRMTKGLILLCGPTGSGKTSLLYAGFKVMLENHRAITTIEDPVEIVLPGVTQMEVKTEMQMTYETLFPSVLRHDPDVIGIGEIRTPGVADQTVQAANTGHLVFSTVHTNDALGAIPRIVGLGVDPYMLGDVLSAVIAQRLVRRVCTQCGKEYALEKNHPWRIRYGLGNGKVILKKGKGCALCAGTGYYGRIAVNEFMMATPRLREAIQKSATRYEMEKILREEGYQTYLEDAIEKAKQGITTFEDVDDLYYDYPGAEELLQKAERRGETIGKQ